MNKWLSRGLVFAALMVVVRLVQGALINQFETHALLISLVLLTVFTLAVLAWGYIDGRRDARANPDPDRREDFAMTWLLAGLFAGVVSGAISWLISLVYKALYVGGLISELTTFAAFTALLVFVPAILAVAIGRWLVDRKAPPYERRREGDDERADTDVFAAVRDDTPTGEIPVASEAGSEARSTEEHRGAVATAERTDDAEHTEVIEPEDRKDS